MKGPAVGRMIKLHSGLFSFKNATTHPFIHSFTKHQELTLPRTMYRTAKSGYFFSNNHLTLLWIQCWEPKRWVKRKNNPSTHDLFPKELTPYFPYTQTVLKILHTHTHHNGYNVFFSNPNVLIIHINYLIYIDNNNKNIWSEQEKKAISRRGKTYFCKKEETRVQKVRPYELA